MTDTAQEIVLEDGGRLILRAYDVKTDPGQIIRLTVAAGMVWSLASEADDPFVEIALLDGQLVANSWNGVQSRIALATGRVVDRRTVK